MDRDKLTSIEGYWKIYPENCNSHQIDGEYMVHGGDVLAVADKYAAITVEKFLNDNCGTALTPLTCGVNQCSFRKACKTGDTLYINSYILKWPTTKHRIDVVSELFHNEELVFKGTFSFCSFIYSEDEYVLYPHGLN